MQTTTDHIKIIVRIAELANRTDTTLDQLHGIDREFGIRLFDPATIGRMNETNIAENALAKYLNSICSEDLRRIHSLMYAGRDEESVLEMDSYFRSRQVTKDDMVRTIIEKRYNLSEYLDRGLERASADGTNTNDF